MLSIPFSLRSLVVAACLGSQIAPAAADPFFAPFKEALFRYPPLTAYSGDGSFIDVDYSEARDIDARDEVPERRVKRDYVALGDSVSPDERVVATAAGPLAFATVGDWDSPGAIVLFIHGRGGDRRLGMNDWTFGGNFNRLKNLVARASGLYVTADAGAFSASDRQRISALIAALAEKRPEAPLVLTCGSMGGELCWELAMQPETLRSIDGIVLLGSNSIGDRFAAMKQATNGRQIPVLFAHGSKDRVFAWEGQKQLFEELRKRWPAYPLRFVSFEGGTHGTPIRMIDWRDTLNWILANARPT